MIEREGFVSVNPWNGCTVFEKSYINYDECSRLISAQYEYWNKDWRHVSPDQRSKRLMDIPHKLRVNMSFYASVITQETGKPVDQSLAEIQKCIQLCEWYLEHGSTFLEEQEVDYALRASSVIFQPTGIILGIMPWNFPFWQVFRYAFSNLLAGNVVALKPAPSVGWSGLLLQQLMGDFPGFQTYFCGHELIPTIISRPEIAGVTFTGSELTGRSIAQLAGQYLKKCVLELGGSDPAIVTASADLTLAAESLLASRLNNNGQTCIAAKRWMVDSQIKDAFLQQVRAQSQRIIFGDPAQAGTQISCMINKVAFDRLQNQVGRAVSDNSVLEQLCNPSDLHPLCALPSLLHTSNSPSSWYFEEFFGPVAIFQEFSSMEEAIKIANSSPYGLGATVWSSDAQEFGLLFNHLETGNVAWNQIMRSDPSIPFGGIKHSGFGKELGKEGIYEFLNAKYIHY
jgi:succinate-semialdehyde dehydrogenase / glutarate-semialdehyde dehydrogenase